MRHETVTTWRARISLAGPLACREYCRNVGLCVTVEPTRFIYVGGEETGAVIGLINYPRFPDTQEEITDKARNLALMLLGKTYQDSVLVMTPDSTEWMTKRV